MDKTTLEYLFFCQIFSTEKYAQTHSEAIYEKEILMSRLIIDNGWNIGSLFLYYKNVDFTFKHKKPSEYEFPFFDDIMWLHHKNVLWNVYELVFIKGNRLNISTV